VQQEEFLLIKHRNDLCLIGFLENVCLQRDESHELRKELTDRVPLCCELMRVSKLLDVRLHHLYDAA
jgi:hypothetical protein